MKPPLNGPIILGGTGCVGRALKAVWPADEPAIWQTRHTGAFCWDILNEAPPAAPAEATGIIALAGVTSGSELSLNSDLAIAACELGACHGLRVLLASSQAVYGRPSDTASEDTPCEPTTDYGKAKLAMEQAVAHFENVTILRISNVLGCDNLMQNAARGNRLGLDRFPNGEAPHRSYIGPMVLGDVLRGLLAYPAPLPHVLNVGQPGSTSMADVLTAASIEWDWVDAGPNALHRLDLDVGKLTSILSVPDVDPHRLILEAHAAGWPNN